MIYIVVGVTAFLFCVMSLFSANFLSRLTPMDVVRLSGGGNDFQVETEMVFTETSPSFGSIGVAAD